MKTVATILPGVVIVEPPLLEDNRGYFAELYSPGAFAANALTTEVTQVAIAWNKNKGTLRGLHYQMSPHAQTKLVRCTRGAIYDVVVDLRVDSPTYRRWLGLELAPTPVKLLYIPRGFAHGYQVLADDTEVWYQIGGAYNQGSERGVRWDDPELGINWPFAPAVMSDRDKTMPNLSDAVVFNAGGDR